MQYFKVRSRTPIYSLSITLISIIISVILIILNVPYIITEIPTTFVIIRIY